MLYLLLAVLDISVVIDMTPTAGITIIHMGTMALRMGIKATGIEVDGNAIHGHGDIKGRK